VKATTRFPRNVRHHIQTLASLRDAVQLVLHDTKPRLVFEPTYKSTELYEALTWLLKHLTSPHLGHFDGCPKSPHGPPVPLTETEAADVRREVSTAVTALAKALGIYARTARDTSDSAAQHELAEALNAVRCWSMFAPPGSFPLMERFGWGVWHIGKSESYKGHWFASDMSEAEARAKADELNAEMRFEARRKD